MYFGKHNRQRGITLKPISFFLLFILTIVNFLLSCTPGPPVIPQPTPASNITHPSPNHTTELTDNQTETSVNRTLPVIEIPATEPSANQTTPPMNIPEKIVNQPPTTVIPALPTSPNYTPAQEYAKSRGLSPEIIDALKSLGILDDTVKEYVDLLALGEPAYPSLFRELVNLPELKKIDEGSLEAFEDIYNMASSNNTEVREAFDLMINGGTPDLRDYVYEVPNWNTQLEILYNLASQNEFKKDDTLAQAIAIDDGLWITIGDDEVKQAVYKDSNDLLNFFRETNEVQKARGYYQLEEYPLEAKLYLSWRGNDLGRGGHVHYGLMSGGPTQPKAVNIHIFYENQIKRITLGDYIWNNVSISTLIKIREYIDNKRLFNKNADMFVSILENYFRGYIFTEPKDDWLTYRGEKTVNHNMNNANLEFDYLLENGKAIGVCDDEMTIVDAFLKSWGIPSGSMTRTYGTEDGSNHTHVFYYEPALRTWKSYEQQLTIGAQFECNVYIFLPPIIQHNYYIYYQDNLQWYMKMLNLYHKILGVSGNEVKELFIKGVPTSEVKQWILQK